MASDEKPFPSPGQIRVAFTEGVAEIREAARDARGPIDQWCAQLQAVAELEAVAALVKLEAAALAKEAATGNVESDGRQETAASIALRGMLRARGVLP